MLRKVSRLVLIPFGVSAPMVSSPAAHAADASTTPPIAASQPTGSCFASLYDFAMSSADECPLSWNAVTLYGNIDVGVSYETHGVPFNGAYPNGVETLIKKNSNLTGNMIVPNGLGQSSVGVKGDEPLAADWSFVFNLETGFDPYSMQLANGPKSLVENNLNPLAYAGIANKILGALTLGRQDSLMKDGVASYDPTSAAPAFSVVGDSSTV